MPEEEHEEDATLDLLCDRLALSPAGKYSKPGKRFDVSRQTVNPWKIRNQIPKEHWRAAMTLGLTLDELTPARGEAMKGALFRESRACDRG